MGIFNSVYVKCPHCGEMQDEQYKPGSMHSWEFGVDTDIPIEYLHDFQDKEWTCWSCEERFHTHVEIKVEIGEMKISKEPKR